MLHVCRRIRIQSLKPNRATTLLPTVPNFKNHEVGSYRVFVVLELLVVGEPVGNIETCLLYLDTCIVVSKCMPSLTYM